MVRMAPARHWRLLLSDRRLDRGRGLVDVVLESEHGPSGGDLAPHRRYVLRLGRGGPRAHRSFAPIEVVARGGRFYQATLGPLAPNPGHPRFRRVEPVSMIQRRSLRTADTWRPAPTLRRRIHG